MRVAFLHGLESKAISDKSTYLENDMEYAYCPAMNYKDNSLFAKTLNDIKRLDIDVLIGSSMGGWFAYCISTLTGIPTILFNPAFHSRSFSPNVQLGSKKANHIVVLGKNDTLIDHTKTLEYIKEEGIGNFKVNFESNSHRTPINIFKKYVDAYIVNNSSSPFTVMNIEEHINKKF